MSSKLHKIWDSSYGSEKGNDKNDCHQVHIMCHCVKNLVRLILTILLWNLYYCSSFANEKLSRGKMYDLPRSDRWWVLEPELKLISGWVQSHAIHTYIHTSLTHTHTHPFTHLWPPNNHNKSYYCLLSVNCVLGNVKNILYECHVKKQIQDWIKCFRDYSMRL